MTHLYIVVSIDFQFEFLSNSDINVVQYVKEECNLIYLLPVTWPRVLQLQAYKDPHLHVLQLLYCYVNGNC